MRNSIMMVAVLTLVCLLSAMSLALINNITSERIAEQKQKEKLLAISSALPKDQLHYDNDPIKEKASILEWTEKDGTIKEIYIAKKQDEIMGIAFTSIGEGYNGYIKIMIGIKPDETIMGIAILEHNETPGLGSKIENPEFEEQFRDKSAEGSQDNKLSIIKGKKAKNNWEIEALTGATISPLGVVQAVNDGLANYRKYKDRIIGKQ